MAAKVGELFVELGIKGADKTIGSVRAVGDGVKNLGSMSLQAKAAIVGMMYALEKVFESAGQTGLSLKNANSELGMSMDMLQRYQYVAKMAGSSNEAMTGSFLHMQQAMTKLMTEGAHGKWMQLFMQGTGTKVEELPMLQQHPEELLKRLQKLAQDKSINQGVMNEILTEFLGNDPSLRRAVRDNRFTPQALAAAPVHSDSQVNAMDKTREGLTRLQNKFQMASENFAAKFGPELIGDIEPLINKLFKLASAFEMIAKKAEVFKAIGLVFEGWTNIFQGLATLIETISNVDLRDVLPESVADFLGVKSKDEKGDKGKSKEKDKPMTIGNVASNALGKAEDAVLSWLPKGALDALAGDATKQAKTDVKKKAPISKKAASGKVLPFPSPVEPKSVAAPAMPALAVGDNTTQNNTFNINQNYTHDGKDAKKVGTETKSQIQRAMQQQKTNRGT